MENGWMDWIEWMWMWKVESGKWMESGCGKWKVESGAVPDLTIVTFRNSHYTLCQILLTVLQITVAFCTDRFLC